MFYKTMLLSLDRYLICKVFLLEGKNRKKVKHLLDVIAFALEEESSFNNKGNERKGIRFFYCSVLMLVVRR